MLPAFFMISLAKNLWASGIDLSARFGEYRATPKWRNASKMPKVSTDQFQVVVDGGRRNLKVRISKRLSGLLQLGGE
jgi:hypothetical protein